jgi:hypothetical protein
MSCQRFGLFAARQFLWRCELFCSEARSGIADSRVQCSVQSWVACVENASQNTAIAAKNELGESTSLAVLDGMALVLESDEQRSLRIRHVLGAVLETEVAIAGAWPVGARRQGQLCIDENAVAMTSTAYSVHRIPMGLLPITVQGDAAGAVGPRPRPLRGERRGRVGKRKSSQRPLSSRPAPNVATTGWLPRKPRTTRSFVTTVRNIRLTLEEATFREVRVLAAERGLSVSAFLRRELASLVERQRGYAKAREAAVRRLRRGRSLLGGKLASREELHDRAKRR